MELSNLISIYGKPVVKVCPECNGEGCNECKSFGFIAQTPNAEISYTFEYPMYIDLKERSKLDLIKNTILIIATLLFIISIIVSYMLNIR